MLKVIIEITASNNDGTMERDDTQRDIKTIEVHTFLVNDPSGMRELDAANIIRKTLDEIRL